MRGFAGYNFKSNRLNDAQCKVFDDCLAQRYRRHNGKSEFYDLDGATEKVIKDRTYLFANKTNSLHIFGVGSVKDAYGIVWGSHQENVIEVLHYAGIFDFYTYKVVKNVIYYVKDGEIYNYCKKGDRIKTNLCGATIYSIDDLNDICVELDSDKSVFFEFSINEIEKE